MPRRPPARRSAAPGAVVRATLCGALAVLGVGGCGVHARRRYHDGSPHAAEQRIIDEVTAAYGSGSALTPAQTDERAEDERRLALADQDCRDATDWTARRRAVEHELQQEYVDAHRADLDALAAAVGAGGVLD